MAPGRVFLRAKSHPLHRLGVERCVDGNYKHAGCAHHSARRGLGGDVRPRVTIIMTVMTTTSAAGGKPKIDITALPKMTTKELSALAKAHGLGAMQSRGEFINALVEVYQNDQENDDPGRDLRHGRAYGEEDEEFDDEEEDPVVAVRGAIASGTSTPEDDAVGGATTKMMMKTTRTMGGTRMDTNDDDDDTLSGDGYEDEGYFVGSAAFVWEDEVYTYGGLAHEGEFVTNIYRWSGRGACYEVPATATEPEVGLPPGRYGHAAVVHGDLLYVFGGQGQFGCLNDLWVFDFVRCSWTMIDVVGDPPPARTGHCMCISDNVVFVFGGKDVQPGQDVVVYNDLYGFDLAESEWLTIDTKWKHPVGGDGCAMAARNSVLYVLSPSETSVEMVVWVLQLSAQGTPRWTIVARAGQVPSPRTSYLSCVLGANWIIHGGRVLLRDSVLGDTYVFHFPTGEWARLNPESDTDPRFGHAGACVDGALVILHGARDPNIRGSPEETGVCIAINLESYMPFPVGDDEDNVAEGRTYADTIPKYNERDAEQDDAIKDDAKVKQAEKVEEESNLDAKILTQLNKKGVFGTKGGLIGGSLHIPVKGTHDTGNLEIIVGDVKIFAHVDVVIEGSKYLKQLIEMSPLTAALQRTPDVAKLSRSYHPWFGAALAALVQLMYYIAVVVAFTVRRMVAPQKDAMKTLVLKDANVPVVLAALRWIYQIPVHPQPEILLELYELASRLKIDGLPSYCIGRLRKELNVELAASAAKVAFLSHNATLWKASVKIGQQKWNEVSHTDGFVELTTNTPAIARDYSMAIHESVVLPGYSVFSTH